MRTYDQFLSLNEWFIIVTGITAYSLIFFLPKKFTRAQTVLTLFIGIYFVVFFDHTMCVEPLDYYDVNDSNKIDIWDVLSYIMYGPFAYLFIYGYTLLRKSKSTYFFYLLVWTIFSITAEALAWHAGVYHYRRGYRIFFSIPIYLLVLSLTMIYFQLFIRKTENKANRPSKS
ncbi:hypothetical protein [Sporolactobacillus pectinivorans]|uniref:hypothetical protein n=1 Tax=Sporolactobacillus pectinivorans TaxID=1591408 RepID=UPI000C2617A8|nr:hypothetical protein [Sporolactobacillus pectinivorans]